MPERGLAADGQFAKARSMKQRTGIINYAL
jgi:hypothetical protein